MSDETPTPKAEKVYTFKEKMRVAMLIEANHEVVTPNDNPKLQEIKYTNDYSDKKIAEETGLPISLVYNTRNQNYGKLFVAPETKEPKAKASASGVDVAYVKNIRKDLDELGQYVGQTLTTRHNNLVKAVETLKDQGLAIDTALRSVEKDLGDNSKLARALKATVVRMKEDVSAIFLRLDKLKADQDSERTLWEKQIDLVAKIERDVQALKLQSNPSLRVVNK